MTVALGTSTPTSITVVATRTSTSPAANACITASFSSGAIRPCSISRRRSFSGPAASSGASSSTARSGLGFSAVASSGSIRAHTT